MSRRAADLRRALTKRLEAGGIDTPEIDARLLIEAASGITREQLAADPDAALSGEQAERLEALAQRRLKREPMSHILGRRAFWTLDLKSDARALTPRPDTEIVVEAALERLGDTPPRILDLGVGSGAILLALLSERTDAYGVGLDRSAGALNLTAENAGALGLADRLSLIEADWAAPVDGRFDLVVSNPPYIPRADLAGLDPEVGHDPAGALDGGTDGLDAYRVLSAQLPRLMRPFGAAVVEIGAGQGEAVAAIMEAAGALVVAEARRDLGGHVRALVILRAVKMA